MRLIVIALYIGVVIVFFVVNYRAMRPTRFK